VFNEFVGGDRIVLKYANKAYTYYIQSAEGFNRYLKLQPLGCEEPIDTQVQRLLFLQDILPVPQVLDYGVKAGFEYLLTVGLEGIEASNEFYKRNTQEMIRLIAKGLSTIHQVSIQDCPFDNTIAEQMKIVRYKYNKGLIDAAALHKQYGESDLEQLIYEMESAASMLTEDLVFTHGDYSLPNIIIHEGRISGFIDLGKCGIADRYFDLAIAENSIIRNFGMEYVDLFYRSYGIDIVDRSKVRLYQLLESLVWG
jgi:aminoglycoside phosphotransferase